MVSSQGSTQLCRDAIIISELHGEREPHDHGKMLYRSRMLCITGLRLAALRLECVCTIQIAPALNANFVNASFVKAMIHSLSLECECAKIG